MILNLSLVIVEGQHRFQHLQQILLSLHFLSRNVLLPMCALIPWYRRWKPLITLKIVIHMMLMMFIISVHVQDLYLLPLQDIQGKQPIVTVPVGDTGSITHHLRNIFSGGLKIAIRVLEMVAGCSLSMRGPWDGTVTCNELGGVLRAGGRGGVHMLSPGEKFHVHTE
jgi:hypothetical protein